MPVTFLLRPTPELVREANNCFNQDDRYGPADKVLTRIFSLHPRNNNFDDVLIKVVLLNGLYNTHVFAVVEMARHIHQLIIDDDLAAGSMTAVGRIADLTIRGRRRRHYSFATKYCSWHHPDKYPMYDGLVEKQLWRYQCQFEFANFRRADLQEYQKYKDIVSAFRTHFQLEEFTFKQVDKFLWFRSKNLSA
jgi:hypothetical protein